MRLLFLSGGLNFSNVVLNRVENWARIGVTKDKAAAIGFALLKQFDLVVDGEHALAYLQPSRKWKPHAVEAPKQSSPHDSPSAAFAQWHNQSNYFTAYVMNASPAFESGIRNGDILLEVDRRDVKQWLEFPAKAGRPTANGSYSRKRVLPQIA